MTNQPKWLQSEIKTRFILLGLILIIVGSYFGHRYKNFILRQYDAVCLAAFAHRIADADRVVVTWEGSPVSLTLTGDDAQKIVRAVSGAGSTRMPDTELALKYSESVTFYRGPDALGEVLTAYQLFLLNHHEPPFADRSGTLRTLVSTPMEKAMQEFWRTNVGSITMPPNQSVEVTAARS